MSSNKQKVELFLKAVNKYGYNALSDKIGFVTTSKLELARDALSRGQPEAMIANYLYSAMVWFDKDGYNQCNDDADYTVFTRLSELAGE